MHGQKYIKFVIFLLGASPPASEIYVPTFRTLLSHLLGGVGLHHLEDGTEGS